MILCIAIDVCFSAPLLCTAKYYNAYCFYVETIVDRGPIIWYQLPNHNIHDIMGFPGYKALVLQHHYASSHTPNIRYYVRTCQYKDGMEHIVPLETWFWFQMCKYQTQLGDWYLDNSSEHQLWMNTRGSPFVKSALVQVMWWCCQATSQ